MDPEKDFEVVDDSEIDLPDLGTLLEEEKQSSDTPPSSSQEEPATHVPGCKCLSCGNEKRGRHPGGCLCDTCKEKQKNEARESRKSDLLEESLSGVFTVLLGQLNRVCKNVPGYENISQDEIDGFSDSLDNVCEKHDTKIEHKEEITLVGFIISIFVSRIIEVWIAVKKEKERQEKVTVHAEQYRPHNNGTEKQNSDHLRPERYWQV